MKIINHSSTSHNSRVSQVDVETSEAAYTSIETWDMRSAKGHAVASGIYIALVEAQGVGKTLVKFAVLQ